MDNFMNTDIPLSFGWIFLPFAVVVITLSALGRVDAEKPWNGTSRSPFFGRGRRVNREEARIARTILRRSIAVSRYYGASFTVERDALKIAYIRARKSEHWFRLHSRLLPLPFAVLPAVPFIFSGRRFGSDFHGARDFFPFLASILLMFTSAFLMWYVGKRVDRWYGMAANLSAVGHCFLILAVSANLIRGYGSPLDIDRLVSRLCRNLHNYARVDSVLSREGRADSVRAHLAAVEADLQKKSGAVLESGWTALPELIAATVTVLDRLIQERWLNILDVASSEVSSQVPPSDEDLDRRDVRFVISGAIFAAMALAGTAAAGLPLAVGAPVAAALSVGPVALWGRGRVNGVGSSRMVDAVTHSVIQAGGTGSPPTPHAPSASDQTR